MINVALPKGRLGERAYEAFASAGYDCPAILEKNRRLTFENREKGVPVFLKPSDVSIYGERGRPTGWPVGISCWSTSPTCTSCWIWAYRPDAVCAWPGQKTSTTRLPPNPPVATKFPHITAEHYTSSDIDIIRLNGSIELAPILACPT